MKIAVADYAEALYELVSDHPEKVKETVRQFVQTLRRQGRGKLLPIILTELSRVEAKKNGQIEIEVTTPVALTESQKDELEAAVKSAMKEAKSVTLNEIVNTAVLGGIKVKIGENIIDHTVQTKLNALAAKL